MSHKTHKNRLFDTEIQMCAAGAIRTRLSPGIYAFKRMILCFANPHQRSGDEEDGPEGM
ncbi:unnamed protein product [Leuciscus chuanchicus]